MAIKSKPDHDKAAAAFLEKNPEVWGAWQDITREFTNRGFTVVPSNMVFEMVRGRLMLKSGKAFPINRNHRAYLVAKWRKEYPAERDVFEVRSSPYTNRAYLEAGDL